MFKIAVLVSGSGSNLQSIINNIKNGNLNCKLEIVIGDRPCYGIDRAKENGIEGVLVDRKIYKNNLCEEINNILATKEIDLVVLAGFLSIIDEKFVEKWKNKIINIHPSLLPKFGGKGMYGLKVHEAVVANKEKESGCTVHYVDSGVDSGQIILQAKVQVFSSDTAEVLQKRVLVEEHKLLPRAIGEIIKKK
ncbi:MAG: phosphoribosylglycinamide formyltransferase [Fusobacteriaceae bacterium]|jgi:phosphoribosylglycinamide formyltransferase-1|nr:phosphoribosylglycinamide formyltransferase [Fusobacteriaceae bacterium]